MLFFIGWGYWRYSRCDDQSTRDYWTGWTRGWWTSDWIHDSRWTKSSCPNIISCRSDAACFRISDYCV